MSDWELQDIEDDIEYDIPVTRKKKSNKKKKPVLYSEIQVISTKDRKELSSLGSKERSEKKPVLYSEIQVISTKDRKELSSLGAKERSEKKPVLYSEILRINTEDRKELSSLDAKDVTLLAECMEELLMKGSNHDVKLIVKDKEFQAHRLILSARSRVFAMMLNHDTKESNTGTINIDDCDPDSFDEFLLYVYSGKAENLAPNKALHLYYTADKYDLPVLKKRCAVLLRTSLSVESICDVVLLAAKHDEKELLQVATEFFARNIRKILQTVSWQEFLSKNPVEGNELYIKSLDILLPIK